MVVMRKRREGTVLPCWYGDVSSCHRHLPLSYERQQECYRKGEWPGVIGKREEERKAIKLILFIQVSLYCHDYNDYHTNL